MDKLNANEALYVLNGDRRARNDFTHNLAETIGGRDLRKVGDRLLTTIVFDKQIEGQEAAELQVDVAVKVVADDAVGRLQRALDNGSLAFRAEFEAVKPTDDDWGAFAAEPRRLSALSGWDGRWAVLYIRSDFGFDRLGVEIH